jgi:hypothetical protein
MPRESASNHAVREAHARLDAGPWAALSAARRRRAFEAALAQFALDPDPRGTWGSALGLGVLGRGATDGGCAAAGPSFSALRRRSLRAYGAGEELGAHRDVDAAGDAGEGVAWISAELTYGPGATLALVAEELGAGRAALAVVPPPLAGPLEELALCLAEALDVDDDEAPLAVVDDGPREAAETLALATTIERGAPARFVAAARASRALALPPAADDERLAVYTIRAATIVVGERDEAEHAARRVARLAFGLEAAGGFLASAVGAVWVHQRRFAAFHAALLEALEGRAAVPVLPCGRQAELRALHDTVHRLGLDEGATLIHTGNPPAARGGEGAAGRFGVRSVFTNVDPLSRLARELEPAGVLRILRIAAPRGERSEGVLADPLAALEFD